ncbi:MAG TPA: hypothetical protein VF666_21785 [Pyrinomonadaceae bacterium]|jgi:hypothetical protein
MHRNLLLAIAAVAAFLVLGGGADAAHAQSAKRSDDERAYSESNTKTRSRTTNDDDAAKSPARILREARTIFITPSRHLDSKYLEYKLGKYAEFQQWKLAIVKNREKADLVLEVHKRALNYIFSIEEPESSIVVVNGKVVAINDLVAAEDIAGEIVKRMKNTRALPVSDN